jgi:hypothetical protein
VTRGSGSSKSSESKNHWYRFFVRKNQNYRITGSGYFRNMKELAVFMKEPAKNQ